MTVNAGREAHNEVVSQFQTWNKLKKASFSHNDLHSIDYSIVSKIIFDCIDSNPYTSDTSLEIN